MRELTNIEIAQDVTDEIYPWPQNPSFGDIAFRNEVVLTGYHRLEEIDIIAAFGIEDQDK
jgi:hypothetical protein